MSALKRFAVVLAVILATWGTVHGIVTHDTDPTPPAIISSTTISPSAGVVLDNVSGIEISLPPRAPQEIVGALILVAAAFFGLGAIRDAAKLRGR